MHLVTSLLLRRVRGRSLLRQTGPVRPRIGAESAWKLRPAHTVTMPDAVSRDTPSQRSIDWLEVFKVAAVPLVAVVLGFTFNNSLNERQSKENNLRLYADMMARREQADSDLRKDMFKSILDKFTSVQSDPKSVEYLDQQIVNLELLAYNFHESIDLGPLFKIGRAHV